MKIVVSAAQMAAADRYTIDQLGNPGLDLMEAAARGCFDVLTDRAPSPCPIAVLVGPGNNGGDGLALARMLAVAKYSVRVFATKPQAQFKGEAAVMYARLRDAGVEPVTLADLSDLKLESGTAWIVDGLLGTGLEGAARGMAAELIQAVNAIQVPKFAIDIPSGLSGNHGRIMGAHIQAQLTVAIQNLKFPHVVSPACLACGEVAVCDIGIQFPEVANLKTYYCEAVDYARPPRPLDSHKGRYGYLAILGGFQGMSGAANLAGVAALRSGAGKVRILTDHPIQRHDSLMVDHWRTWDPASYDALVIGPGLSRRPEVFTALGKVEVPPKPVLWDADGIYFLKTQTEIPGSPWVMTPHPGEAAYLLGSTAADVQKDRLGAITALADKYPGGWLILKGYRSLVRSPEGELFVIGTGNPALSTAGSGDVLSGMIGSLLAQGLPADEAVLLACLRHGMAADRWIQHHPDHSMIAEDIVDDLRYHP